MQDGLVRGASLMDPMALSAEKHHTELATCRRVLQAIARQRLLGQTHKHVSVQMLAEYIEAPGSSSGKVPYSGWYGASTVLEGIL